MAANNQNDDARHRHLMVSGNLFVESHLTDADFDALVRLLPCDLDADKQGSLRKGLDRVRTAYETAKLNKVREHFSDRQWTQADKDAVMGASDLAQRLRATVAEFSPGAVRQFDAQDPAPLPPYSRIKEQIDGVAAALARVAKAMPEVSPARTSKLEDEAAVFELIRLWEQYVGTHPDRSSNKNGFLYFSAQAAERLGIGVSETHIEKLLRKFTK